VVELLVSLTEESCARSLKMDHMLVDLNTKTKLKDNGINFEVWLAETETMARLVGCREALDNPDPGSNKDAAAMLLIIKSVPDDWIPGLYEMGSAHAAFQHIKAKFQGGSNTLINGVWLKMLEWDPIRTSESCEQFALRKLVLFRLLVGNCAKPDMETLCAVVAHGVQNREACDSSFCRELKSGKAVFGTVDDMLEWVRAIDGTRVPRRWPEKSLRNY
jgi:hypothetical protein